MLNIRIILCDLVSCRIVHCSYTGKYIGHCHRGLRMLKWAYYDYQVRGG